MQKYAKIIMQRKDRELFLSNLKTITGLLQYPKFKEIINLKSLTINEKVEFIISVCDIDSKEFKNCLKILFENKRINEIANLYKELRLLLSMEKNIFNAVVYTEQALKKNELMKYEEIIAKRFNKEIKLENCLTNKKEIRIYIEDLGYEIIVSSNLIKEKLKQHIMKAI